MSYSPFKKYRLMLSGPGGRPPASHMTRCQATTDTRDRLEAPVILKKSDLYSSLWASCDELRGGMDDELSALEARGVKQAMMQELLTGRTRLV